MAERDDSFLTRWARRKEQTQRGAELPDREPPAAPAAPVATETDKSPAEQAEEQAKLIESLPDIDSMTRESDFSVFMQKGVPRALRNKALRKLWRLDPVFANLDGLNDYDEDYTAIGKGLGQVVNTIYQVGKGMHGQEPATESRTEAAKAPESAEDGDAAQPSPNPEPSGAEPVGGGAEGPQAEANQLDEAAPAPSKEKQPEVASSAVPPPADDASPDGAAGRGKASRQEPQRAGRGAAARRWGRFTG